MNAIRFINRNAHGWVDYAGALVLLLTPNIANFQATSTAAYWLSIVAGLALLTYSLLTDYSLSLVKLLPIQTHLLLDAIASIFFIVAPFILGFAGLVRLFFIANGVLVMAAVLLTRTRSAKHSPSLN